MPLKTLYVRINPAQKSVSSFFRCGFAFSQVWRQLVDVDDASAARLQSEQMLEVSETAPVADVVTAGDSAAPSVAAGVGTPALAPVEPVADEPVAAEAKPADSAVKARLKAYLEPVAEPVAKPAAKAKAKVSK